MEQDKLTNLISKTKFKINEKIKIKRTQLDCYRTNNVKFQRELSPVMEPKQVGQLPPLKFRKI